MCVVFFPKDLAQIGPWKPWLPLWLQAGQVLRSVCCALPILQLWPIS